MIERFENQELRYSTRSLYLLPFKALTTLPHLTSAPACLLCKTQHFHPLIPLPYAHPPNPTSSMRCPRNLSPPSQSHPTNSEQGHMHTNCHLPVRAAHWTTFPDMHVRRLSRAVISAHLITEAHASSQKVLNLGNRKGIRYHSDRGKGKQKHLETLGYAL